jgi:hypothetical protein
MHKQNITTTTTTISNVKIKKKKFTQLYHAARCNVVFRAGTIAIAGLLHVARAHSRAAGIVRGR